MEVVQDDSRLVVTLVLLLGVTQRKWREAGFAYAFLVNGERNHPKKSSSLGTMKVKGDGGEVPKEIEMECNDFFDKIP